MRALGFLGGTSAFYVLKQRAGLLKRRPEPSPEERAPATARVARAAGAAAARVAAATER